MLKTGPLGFFTFFTLLFLSLFSFSSLHALTRLLPKNIEQRVAGVGKPGAILHITGAEQKQITLDNNMPAIRCTLKVKEVYKSNLKTQATATGEGKQDYTFFMPNPKFIKGLTPCPVGEQEAFVMVYGDSDLGFATLANIIPIKSGEEGQAQVPASAFKIDHPRLLKQMENFQPKAYQNYKALGLKGSTQMPLEQAKEQLRFVIDQVYPNQPKAAPSNTPGN